ncbi:MAG TPA: CBS domain-containing protein, partial [Ectothiorhodospiraceae bacterium]|nr:CBS domain-containing protein [Ectothiorhodospiraceae bacterium]
MSEERPSGAAQEGRSRSWLEQISQIFKTEPKDRDEILKLLQQARERNLIDGDAIKMIEGVFDVSEMQVRDIMIPRSQMVVVDWKSEPAEFMPDIIESAHSRFPVIGENKDEVYGILLAKDLLPFLFSEGSTNLDMRDLLRPAIFIPESKRLNVLLSDFRNNHNHMAIVVDEYGGVAGLITIEDVLEQIVGEIEDEHDIEDDEADIIALDSGVFNVRALTPVDDFNEHFGSSFSDEEFVTIGGIVMNGFGRMPKEGDSIELAQFKFTIMAANSRRIFLIQVERVESSQQE